MKKVAFSAVELAVIVLFSNPIIAVPSEYSTIQETINASNSSDAAITAPGTYIGNGNRDIDLPGNAITATNTNPQDYVPNEIIVKLRPGVINNTNQQSTKSITWPDSLEQLNNKYKHVSTHPLINRFDKNEEQIKNPAAKDLSQLSLRERHLAARAKRAPKGAVVPNLGNIFKIRFALDANESIQNVLDAYRRDPAVEYAELNYIMHFFLLPGDTYYSVEWALNNTGQPYPIPGGQSASGTPGADIRVPEAWDIYTGSSDVIVAVVDSGVDYTHRDLAAKMWMDQNDYYGYDFGNNDNDPTDELGHGTHCAGIIAADTDNGQDIAGVCWNARIMAVKCSDTSNLIAVDYAVGAIHYAVDNGADIISCSWGGTVYSQSLEEAINYAYNRGVIVVAAAGNDNSSSPSYPAYYEHVISVAATDSSDNKASFSNYGEWIDLAAPGVDILSLRAKKTDMYLGSQGYIPGDSFIPFANPHATMYIASGTSMACPQVAGACALLLSANPALTVNEVNDILSETVDSIADGICRSDGRLNVFRALEQTINSKSKGNVALDSAYYGCDSNIGVFLSDGDLSSEMAHSVNITAGSGDVEIINLNSKYPSVGAFGGTIRTQAGQPSIGDGVLQVTNGDIVTVVYSDADDGTGNPATATDTAAIDCVPPVISNVQTEIKASNLTVTFNSNEPAAGKVFCGTVCGGPYNLEGANPALKRNQQIELFPLGPFTTYYFIVTAADAAGNQVIDSNSGNCFSFTTSGPGYMNVPGQFATIQQAIDYAWEGSTIIVADGVYTGQGNRDIDFLGKAITVKGENGPDNCIIDCQANENDPHRGFYFKSGEGPDSIIDGFTITNGFGPSDFWDGYEFRKVGGALHLYYSSPTIKNCRIIANRTSYCNGCADGLGGGVFCDHSNSVIMNCKILRNTAGYGDGGGIYGLNSGVTIINCEISNNHAVRGCGTYFEGADPAINGCIVRDNASYAGGRGSLYFEGSSPTITNCLITGNKAYPGGICSWNGGGYATINNCTIVNNTEAAWGGAIYWDDSASVTNCICRGNHSAGLTGGYREIYKENVTVNYTNIQDNGDPADWKYIDGIGNIDADPLFLAAGFYYLGPGSPCIDAGTNSPPGGLSDTDIDGTVRPIDGDNDGISIADMGCYEFYPDLPPVIWLSQQEFSFVAVEGGPNPASQILSVRNIGTGTLNWSVSENCDWLQAEPASGQSSGETDEVTLSINTSGLSSGTYQCILTVYADGAVNNPQTVWINLFVGKSQIELSANNFAFTGIHNLSNPPPQTLTIRNSGVGTLNWTIDSGCEWLVADPCFGSSAGETDNVILNVNSSGLDVGAYNCTLTVSDPCASNSPQTINITLDIYNPNYDGILSVPSEYTTIQEAIDQALDGNTVLVADGTYTGPGNRDIDFKGKAITVKSENGPQDCIINCNGTYAENHRGFYFHNGEGRNSLLEGFTITNAYVVVFGEGGAGININGASPVINNCIVTNNHTELDPMSMGFCLGGGIYVSNGNPSIINSVINGNSIGNWGWGGGISCEFAQPAICNCLISNNTAFGYQSWGGGIYGSGWTLTNCTIVNNSTSGDGAGFYGSGTIKDSIIWSNTGLTQISGSPAITYSDIQGGFSGTGNINADPCFVVGPDGDYYLSQIAAGQAIDSPCVNAGSDTAANLGMDSKTTRTDEIGDKGIVDMGYHYLNCYGSPDLNRDAFIDFFDYALLANNWLMSPDPCDPNSGDITRNGQVDIYDLTQLVKSWLNCLVTSATNPQPADNATDINRNAVLMWSPGENTVSHDVYFGTNLNEIYNADTSSAQFMGNQDVNYWDSNSYSPDGLDANKTYYWRIDEAGPVCTAKGGVWRFTTVPLLPGQASNPVPTDGATVVSITADLSWTIGSDANSHDVYFGTDNPPPFKVNQTGTTYDTGTMLTNTTYYWRIDEKNVSGTTTGNIWNFTTAVILPGQASNPTPANGATNIDATTDLIWTAGSLATSHDIYFGTINPPPFIGNQTGTTYDTGTMDVNTTYYWRIDEKNASGTTEGNLWNFTTLPVPLQAYDPIPTNGATNVGVTIDLSWSAGSYATSHDIYFGTTNPPPFRVNQTSTTYDTGTMDTNTTYYWRIDEKNTSGTTTGNLWNFKTIIQTPGQATNPIPADGATNVNTLRDIIWTAGSLATSHDIYFGTINPPPFIGNQTGTIYDTGTMDVNTTYYWRIDEKNASGTTAGILWSFTTGSMGDVNDTNLVAWWKLDETSGTIAHDSKGTNDGNLINGPTWTTGKINGGLSFDGVNDYVLVPDSSPLDISNTFTIAFWMYVDLNAIPGGTVLSKDGVGHDTTGAYNIYTGSRVIVYETNNKSPMVTTDSNSLAPEWNHVAVSFDNSASPKMRIYINAAESKTGSPPAPSILTTSLLIGRRGYLDGFNSKLDDIRIYSRTLTADEIALLYQQGNQIIQPPGQASNPNPADTETGVGITTDLNWTADINATSHDIYFGTTNPPSFCVNQTGTTYDTGTMDTNTNYYWRIDEKNASGTTTGDDWSFATIVQLPGQATNPIPADTAIGIGIMQDLIWTAGSYATSHDVYFGTINPPPFIGNQTGTTYDTGTMDVNTTYYWRIDEKNRTGTTIGNIWNFKTQKEFKITASDGASSDLFGYSVSISGNRCIVGAYGDDDKGSSSGSAYIFEWNGTSLIQKAKLTASDGASLDYFSYQVSIDGDRCIVGAYGDDDKGTDSGSAYIFEWTGTSWIQQAKLTASDGASLDYFGYPVSIDGDRCIVGAHLDDDKGSSSGSAYIFEWNGTNWIEQAKLTPPDGNVGDRFGSSVNIGGDRCIVGAQYDDDKGTDSGSAYIFEWNGTSWIQKAKLTASDGASSDLFGYSVSISGDRCIVGAYLDDDKGSGSGSAYIFKWNGTSWIQKAKMWASDGASSDSFGRAVSINGDRCIAGAHLDDDKGSSSGSAYIYELGP